MKKIMAVYDADPVYADRFADFVNQRGQIPFEVLAFTSLQRLKDYAGTHELELLLISSGVERREVESIPARQVMTLADWEAIPVEDQYPSIYKYQSADSIIREVMACYGAQPEAEPFAQTGKSSRIIGVYSPVGRCLKTSFSLTLGQLLSRDAKVLYLNLEDCSGLSKLMGEEYRGGLSDVLYFYREGCCSWVRLSSVVYSWGGLDYVPPVRYPEDLSQITAEDMKKLLLLIASESGYQAIVVDFGQLGRAAAQVLDICDVIYMPVKDDCISAAKVEEFWEYLEESRRSSLKEKIKKLKLPYHSNFGRKEDYLEQLLWGELGDYVRQLLSGYKDWEGV